MPFRVSSSSYSGCSSSSSGGSGGGGVVVVVAVCPILSPLLCFHSLTYLFGIV